HAGPVPVHERARGRYVIERVLVKKPSRVLFEMDADQSDLLRARRRVDFDPSAGRERPVVLGDLVALREIRIEVVLPGETGVLVDGRADCERETHREGHGLTVQDRKGSGEAQADGARRGV